MTASPDVAGGDIVAGESGGIDADTGGGGIGGRDGDWGSDGRGCSGRDCGMGSLGISRPRGASAATVDGKAALGGAADGDEVACGHGRTDDSGGGDSNCG